MHRPSIDADRVETIAAPPLALSLHWKKNVIAELRTHWADNVTESTELTPAARSLKTALTRYVSGKAPEWPELPIDLSRLTDFHRRVLAALAHIPSGQTRSYGQLAADAGSPKAARAIGRAMATNPYPLLYP